MATNHSTSGRTKGSNDKIVVPSWNSIWDSFKEENEKTTIDEMNRQGWKTIVQAARITGLSRQRINTMANDGKLDFIKRKVFHGGSTREINFVKPKTP